MLRPQRVPPAGKLPPDALVVSHRMLTPGAVHTRSAAGSGPANLQPSMKKKADEQPAATSAEESPKPLKPVRVTVGNLPVFHEGEYRKPGENIEVHAERAHELISTGHVVPEKAEAAG